MAKMEKITKLTQHQVDRMPFVRDKWLKIGLSTELCDRDLVERQIDEVYKIVGLDPPGIRVWLRSPLEGCIGAHLLSQVGDQVRAQVRDQVWDQVRDQVWDQVRDQVWGQVWAQVGAQVGDQVRAQVRDQVMAQVMAQVSKCGYGIHDAGWLSFYDYWSEYLDLLIIQPLLSLSGNVGWWWPFHNAVVLTERPCFICRDEQNRLHHENRMAIEYPDGFGVYAWHGVRVPRNVILHPEEITPESALKEQNQEIRRIMLERYGWDRLLVDLKATVEHEDETGRLVSTNRLGEYLDGSDSVSKFVLVVDASTDRRYALQVPPNIERARQGVAWTFGMQEKDYRPIYET